MPLKAMDEVDPNRRPVVSGGTECLSLFGDYSGVEKPATRAHRWDLPTLHHGLCTLSRSSNEI